MTLFWSYSLIDGAKQLYRPNSQTMEVFSKQKCLYKPVASCHVFLTYFFHRRLLLKLDTQRGETIYWPVLAANKLTINVQINIMSLTEFKPRTSSVKSDRTTNWATTTALVQMIKWRLVTMGIARKYHDVVIIGLGNISRFYASQNITLK